jgi:hypothetical protein
MRLRFQVDVEPVRAHELKTWVEAHSSLERVLKAAWAIGTDVVETIAQDEFSHDALVPLPDGLILVYDTT